MKKAFFIIFIVLLLDQILKIWVKTHFFLAEDMPVLGNWFVLHFTENNGMAFGMELGVSYGKLLLSLFRLVAIGVIGVYLFRSTKRGAKNCLIISLSLILAGAIGNVLDSAFYGMIFSESTFYQKAVFMPIDGGYSSFLHGRVVDMLYFPLFEFQWPQWMPFIGGEDFLFFSPVFNLADSAITLGVVLLILFQKKLFGVPASETNENEIKVLNEQS